MLPQSVRTGPDPGNSGYPGADYRPEPSGAVRPAGLARVPGAGRGGLPGLRRVPQGPGDPAYEVSTGCELYKYRPYRPAAASSASSPSTCTRSSRRRGYARPATGRFAVIQACNPPDIFWPLALAFRALEGPASSSTTTTCAPSCSVSLSSGPKLAYKGAAGPGAPHHRAANHVISTNDSYRDDRDDAGRQAAEDMTVVRTGPARGGCAR